MNSDMIQRLQSCLATLPVEKAWLFGSYSRGEERPDSDIFAAKTANEDKVLIYERAS